MSIFVVYKSISGFTKKYAAWIAEDLNVSAYELNEFKKITLHENDIVVFGGSMHAIGINGFKEIKKYLSNRKFRKLIVFAVGASPKKAGIEQEIIDNNFNESDQKKYSVLLSPRWF
jgi:menaquinone-dependent protoporphyrinogen IX oxidase